jgi:putative restriction endonuclease
VDDNLALREAAIRHCRLLSLRWGEAVPYEELKRGFPFREVRVHLVGPQGVFKPKELTDGPLTLLSTLASTYQDEHLDGDQVLYDYAPPQREYENAGLKAIAQKGRHVILLKQVKAKPSPEYMVFAPVALIAFDDVTRKVHLSLATAAQEVAGIPSPSPSVFSKAYADTNGKARLHQAHFRKGVLAAYAGRCCICELRERPLLDAAHIIPDRLPEGVAAVRNGLAMCPTHHRAYDQDIVVVNDTYRVEIRRDRLDHAGAEATARMLLDFDGKPIWLPKDEGLRPEPEFLRKKLGLVA